MKFRRFFDDLIGKTLERAIHVRTNKELFDTGRAPYWPTRTHTNEILTRYPYPDWKKRVRLAELDQKKAKILAVEGALMGTGIAAIPASLYLAYDSVYNSEYPKKRKSKYFS